MCLWEIPINEHLWEMFYCQEIAISPISGKKLKCITEYDELRGNYLNIDVLEISMNELVDIDGPLDDNEPIHKSWLQDANKTKAFSCLLTVRWHFNM